MKNKLKTGIYQKQNDTKLYDNRVGKYPEIKGLNLVSTFSRFYLSFKPMPKPNMAATKAR